MSEQRMPVESLDPRDDEATRRWAAQLGVTLPELQEAVAAIGTDLDKIKLWLVTRGGGAEAAV